MYTGILNCQLIETKGYMYNQTKSAVNEVLFRTNYMLKDKTPIKYCCTLLIIMCLIKSYLQNSFI